MDKKITYGDTSPIAAFATSAGGSALTVIRCSGNGSIEMCSKIFSASKKLKDAAGNSIVYGWITSYANKIDEVLISVFRAPKSYTGEDSLDISCHGGAVNAAAVMEALKTAGFREALPGEFTFRAFINGKIDLTQSESVMELVSAKTEEYRRHAVMRLSGSLQIEINEIKNRLVEVLAASEIYLDYSEDEIEDGTSDEEIGRLPKKELALQVLNRLKKLYASWQLERLYKDGITLVIAGCPNAGKSSLFNSLLKEDRSIVTDIPGTTRDWIEAWTSIKGIPIRLIDTAGLRDSDDSVEKIGVERSRKLLDEEADVILYLLDGTKGVTAEDKDFIDQYRDKERLLVVLNKADLIDRIHISNSISSLMPERTESSLCLRENIIAISAKTGEGIENLYTAIISSIHSFYSQSDLQYSGVALGTERQKNLAGAACDALEEALKLADAEEPLDLIAPLLREAVNSLGEITGEVSTADILEVMFSRFCVGK